MTEHEGTYNTFHSWHSVMCSDVWLKRYKEEDSVILGSHTAPGFNDSSVFWFNTIPLSSKAKMSWNIRLCLPTDPASLHRWMEASATPVQCCRKNKISLVYITVLFSILDLIHIYRVSQEERAKLRESVPYVKLYRYNPKHLYPKLNGYGDNGKRSL